MKICLINSFFYPDKKGGAETVVYNIANELKNRNYKVVVICAGLEKEKTTEEYLDGFKIYRVGFDKYFPFHNIDNENIFSRLLWRIHQFNNKFSSKNIQTIITKENPDLILTHNVLGLGYNIIKDINKFKKKHITTIHDVQLVIPSGVMTKEAKINDINKIYMFFTKNIYRKCKYIISPSQKLVDFYSKYKFFQDAKINILPNPIQLQKISTQEKKHDELKVLYIGQLEEHKGLSDLIKTFKKLDAKKFHLTIAGRGQMAEKINNIAYTVSNIDFVGEYYAQKRIKLLEESDIVAIPSKCFENSPMVMYESWLSGVPVIVSDFGGLPELIKEYKNGWTFEMGNIDDLKLKLEDIYKNKEKLDEISKYCLEYVKKFDVSKYVDKILNI
ncbi:MAG: glycosyltransferase [Patescibacteria group bacterium]|nr:glycosyltransferase [Patescibacteria group bacterium]MDD4304316.1 glycosyltransferase [Patescibacteria group bacterium]MDD4695579.1 glycosyltransferase [Patescibacteria group bacterium]